jgi:hypothetical protein
MVTDPYMAYSNLNKTIAIAQRIDHYTTVYMATDTLKVHTDEYAQMYIHILFHDCNVLFGLVSSELSALT